MSWLTLMDNWNKADPIYSNTPSHIRYAHYQNIDESIINSGLSSDDDDNLELIVIARNGSIMYRNGPCLYFTSFQAWTGW